ncbi:methylated-DNA--[protein]-cysteine S-methyltransferase [Variovorax sp. J22P168]|uniref:methylated-DNA--[protein]-cysteine S-methyltransferase n=1 Tax=Variovorax jilinensis TaxID=3053513 RepID=UPI002576B1DD|nr:methylated-DNA--[protein]-cysteine S-methyltransferase [Variovorax sp. J22P168]MDM0013258.1 methylated-DNA--[protein]-cysteine S-methyltransferase [Variovorax sp. J22P168]
MNPESSGGFALFDTTIGHCGIAWGPRGIVGVRLPEAQEETTRSRMQRRFAPLPECEPSPEARHAIDSIGALLEGRPLDLLDIALDYEGVSELHRRIYEIARRIPPGRTRTYGDIASELGDKGLARAVGQALGLNPFAPVVPCHRILAAGGKWGGFSAPGGMDAKLRMLAIEGARPDSDTAPLF